MACPTRLRVLRAWRAIYKPEDQSGGERVQGWINVLFPYLPALQGNRPRDLAPYLDPAGAPPMTAPRPSDYPLGLCRAPFTWVLPREERAMELLAGHVGVAQDPAGGGSMRPCFGWCVAPRAPDRQFDLSAYAVDGSCTAMPADAAALRSLSTLADEVAGSTASR